MIKEFRIGEKIKSRRLELALTQNDLASDKITRNMISLIENGKAIPSLDTALYLCKALDIPLSYLFSKSETLNAFQKEDKISYIRELYAKENYSHCIRIIEKLSVDDDELNYLLALCHFKLGRELIRKGELLSAEKNLREAMQFSKITVYDTTEIEACSLLYLSISQNIEAPLLEFEASKYDEIHNKAFDYEFYKYTTMDMDYEYTDPLLKIHMAGKKLLKRYSFTDAIKKLLEVEEYKNTDKYNAFVFFGVYSDLEKAYRQLGDFENAYRYSTKRISMIKNFNS